MRDGSALMRSARLLVPATSGPLALVAAVAGATAALPATRERGECHRDAQPQGPLCGARRSGLNEYRGLYWSTSEALGPTLDALRQSHPELALFITEFGAEANRSGPATERGTHEFQADYLRYHLDVFAQRLYINGVQIWVLREFAVMPGWASGNPVPSPLFHRKGLVGLHGEPKPAFEEVAVVFRETSATR